MKISALKGLIKEAVREVVKEEMVLMERRIAKRTKNLLQEGQIQQSAPSQSGIDEIREKFQRSRSTTGLSEYSGLDGKAPKSAPRGSFGKPNNPREVVDGEVYASGQNVLEWFEKSKNQSALDDHRKALEKMQQTDEYVQEIIGKRRI